MKGRPVINVFICILLLISVSLRAQKENDDTVIRKFVKSIALTRQAPVSAEMRIESRADVNNIPEDNYTLTGSFYIRRNAVYIRMGETEQLMNDSVAVLVSNDTRQILLKDLNSSMSQAQLPGMQWAGQEEPTIRKLSGQYTGVLDGADVILTSRAILPGTKLPKETVRMKINAGSGFPEEVLVVRKKIVIIDSLQMVQMRAEQQIPAERFVHSGGVYHVIKEIAIKMTYGSVSTENTAVPVKVEERLRKAPDGEWTPAQAYADFRVIDQTNNN